MDKATELVAKQYTAYAYPEPLLDLSGPAALARTQVGDPRYFAPLLWPEGRPGRRLDILVAGCGTNQAAQLAFNNPDCQVVGVDLSAESIAHEKYLAERHNLRNLDLYVGDLRSVGALGRPFDVIFSTGVIHHMADPAEGLRALAEVLKPQGVMLLMVYGQVRRTGVYLLQDAFRRLGLQQKPEDVATVRTVLDNLPADHPVRPYVNDAHDLAADSGIVDTFLHPQDRAYTVPQVLDLVSGAGLWFQGWAHNALYDPRAALPASLQPLTASLPLEEQWAVVEAFTASLGRHAFTVRERTAPRCRISFDGDDWLNYRPAHHPGLTVTQTPDVTTGARGLYAREGQPFPVSAAEHVLLSQCDGKTAVSRLLEDVRFVGHGRQQILNFGRRFFADMHARGHLMFTVR